MIKSPLLWMALSFIGGAFSGGFFSFYPLAALTVLLLLFGIEIAIRPFGLKFSHYLLIFLSFWGGFLSVEWKESYLPENDISRWSGETVIYTGIIDEAVAHYPDHAVLVLESIQVEKESKDFQASGRIKLNINRPATLPLSYGDEIRVPLTLREPHGFQNFTGFDYGLYLRRHGIRATASLTHPEEILLTGKKGGSALLRKVYTWREEIRKKAAETLSGEGLAIFLAMVIGESGYLTNSIRDDFMASGTTHILSISGSHLALVAFLFFNGTKWMILRIPEPLLLRLGRRILPSRLALFLSVPPVFLYGLLAGNQVATNRSMLMIAIFLLGQILNREQNLLNPLGLSALAILLFDPYQVYDISFQLSFGSVLSIALALERLHSVSPLENKKDKPDKEVSLFSKSLRGIKNYLWISLATTLGTAPLVAYHFNQFNWVGILANGIIIPLAGFLAVPVALLSSFGTLLFSSGSLYAGHLNQFLMSGFYKIVRFFASFPYAELHLASPSLFQLLLFYLLILALLYLRLSPKRRNALMILIFFLPLWWFWAPRIHFPSRELRATFLDVGQGDSALIEFPDGETLLIDGGGRYHEFDSGRLVVAPFLWNKGIDRINYLVATHPQADHIGGLVYLLKKFSIGEVWTNGTTKESRIAKEFDDSVMEKKLNRRIAEEGYFLQSGELYLQVLNPNLKNPVSSSAHAKENNDGIVIKIDYGRKSLLFTADIEEEAEKRILADHPGIKATLLKVPHHGGRGSADPEFIQSLSPEISVFSVGLHNPYHHPSPDTLLLYQKIPTDIHRTDQEGAFRFKTDGEKAEEIAARTLLPVKIRFGKEIWKEERENWLKVFGKTH
jgi:competence protein ComEC